MRFFHRKKDRLLREFIEFIPSLSDEELEQLNGVLLALDLYLRLRGHRRRGDPILVDPMLVELPDGSIFELQDPIIQSMVRVLDLIVQEEKMIL